MRNHGWAGGAPAGANPPPEANATAVAVVPWEARFRASKTLWVRMAADRPERAIACTNVTGVLQVHRWRVGETVGEAMTAFPTGKGAAWISPDGEWVVWHADRAGDEIGHFVALPWAGGESIDLTPDLPAYASFAAGFGPDGSFGCSIIGNDRVQLAIVPFPPGDAAPRLLDPGPGFVTGLAVGPAGTVAYSTTAGRGLQTLLRVIDGSTGETRWEVDHVPGAIRVLEYAASGRLRVDDAHRRGPTADRGARRVGARLPAARRARRAVAGGHLGGRPDRVVDRGASDGGAPRPARRRTRHGADGR